MLTTTKSPRAVAMPTLGFTLVLLCLASGIWLSVRQHNAIGWMRHTLEVENRLNLVQRLATDAETGQRGYLLSHNEIYLQPYRDAVTRMPREVDALEAAVVDNPRESDTLRKLRPAIQGKLDELGATIALARMGRSAEAIDILCSDVGRQYMVQIRAAITAMTGEEEGLLAARSTAVRRGNILAMSTIVLSCLLVLLLGVATVRDGRRRLRTLETVNRQLLEESEHRKKAQSQVRQLQKMEAVGQLTGGIAHDFNNMLAIVIGGLDLARRRLTASEHPKVRECIDHAAEGAQRAATLTARLLAFSRQQPLEPKVLAPQTLIGAMSDMLRRTLGASISVETVFAGGLWNIYADPAQLETALVNLAVNARDAMPDGGKLTIETANADLDDGYARAHEEVRAGQYVMLSVSDTGSGMPPEVVERAFDPFYTTKAVGRGTGLGLSQIFGFVKQSDGHVKIYSEVGRGTTVKLYLPRYKGAGIAVGPNLQVVGTPPSGHVEEVILVVDDEAQVRHMSVDALRELGYSVLQAADGREALEQLAAVTEIDMLFTDIVMPGMTGRQLADEALRRRPSLKVLYTTGYTRNAIVHNGIVDDGVAFLTKPFSLDNLARKVRDVLDEA